MKTTDSVRAIKGIGEKAESVLGRMKIETVADLLMHYPRDYEEFQPIRQIASLSEGEMAAIEGCLTGLPKMSKHGNLSIVKAVLRDETGEIPVVFYNMPFMRGQLKMGTRYLLRGKVTKKREGMVMEQPRRYGKEEFYRQLGKLRPVYPLTAGITNNALIKAITQALEETEDLLDFLPADIRKRHQLISYKKALRQIHFPKDRREWKDARERLVFDELFFYSLALSQIRKSGKKKSIHVMHGKEKMMAFTKELPFSLTDAQCRVCEEIADNMADGSVMNRLVQGDVGSGKTIVAVAALYLTALNKKQGAFMVPTEVLANQHYKVLCSFLEPYGICVGLLTGSMSAKEKRESREKIRTGVWDVVVGTHTIIQDHTEFLNLALVITDEQHRFGVKQRECLFRKGKEPHVLAMSATPIPRTLALILYGDMDLSVVDECPQDRLPIKNCVVNTEYRPRAYRFMKDQIDNGRQVYIICPMVDTNEEMELENVSIYTEDLRGIFPSCVRIEGLHGKMPPKKKDEIMEAYAAGEIDILVSTTVIEVGIDVPNATVIMIENAERFGLAQLHQLRGRVGRGKEQSYCIFMIGRASSDSVGRLQILASSNDGFYIAEEDLKLRGQGDLFGVRQSGEQIFVLADIFEDAGILEKAGSEAGRMENVDIEKLCEKSGECAGRIAKYMDSPAIL